jgi:hypothetical protein
MNRSHMGLSRFSWPCRSWCGGAVSGRIRLNRVVGHNEIRDSGSSPTSSFSVFWHSDSHTSKVIELGHDSAEFFGGTVMPARRRSATATPKQGAERTVPSLLASLLFSLRLSRDTNAVLDSTRGLRPSINARRDQRPPGRTCFSPPAN